MEQVRKKTEVYNLLGEKVFMSYNNHSSEKINLPEDIYFVSHSDLSGNIISTERWIIE
jgi:hypothetical protein